LGQWTSRFVSSPLHLETYFLSTGFSYLGREKSHTKQSPVNRGATALTVSDVSQ
jgi:hypothetical protein